jgi:hypothetical protein
VDTSFIDLDVLLTRIRNPRSKVYFLDAVKAYKAGALRGALTSAWVAIVYDLIAKYRALSALGDAAATAFLLSWDNATTAGDVSRLLTLERTIIEDATVNTQVVNRIARTQLDRLREDRHLCAHPAFSAEADLFEPSAELVRLHLVNSVDLVLSQEPLQGRAISELFDVDVQSLGFPTIHDRIVDYVEQRYLSRVRAQNVRNFGTVLAKSLLKGVPATWESHQQKIISSLIAIRERTPDAWPELSGAIVLLIDNLSPADRPRAIAFLASFHDFWPRLQHPTQTALQATVDNARNAPVLDQRVLSGVSFPMFSEPLVALIANMSREQLLESVVYLPRAQLWPRVLSEYRGSAGWRRSELNFRELIQPFANNLSGQQIGQVLDAVIDNYQNWNAGDTSVLLAALLRDISIDNLPPSEVRDRFYRDLHGVRRIGVYDAAINALQSDGWRPPEIQELDEDALE